MKKFIYVVVKLNHSTKNPINRIVTVYELKRNEPYFVGSQSFSSGMTNGEYAQACKVISEVQGHQLTKCGYFLKSKDIKVSGISPVDRL